MFYLLCTYTYIMLLYTQPVSGAWTHLALFHIRNTHHSTSCICTSVHIYVFTVTTEVLTCMYCVCMLLEKMCVYSLVSYSLFLHYTFFSVVIESLLAVIDGYTAMGNFANEDEIRLGRQLILVCRVVGLPYGTLLSYTWTCPSGPCEVEGYYGRKVYNEHILAVNTTSPRDGGTYTCQVTATGGSVQQETRALFRFTVVGELCT